MPRTSISPARIGALRILEQVFSEGKTLLESLPLLEEELLKPNDFALAREIISGVCRRWGTLRHVLYELAPRLDNFPAVVQRILELSLYQLMYLDKVPPYAVLSDAVELVRKRKCPGLTGPVNGILRNYQRSQDQIRIPQAKVDFPAYLTVQHSHPRWLVNRWLELWPKERVESLCAFNNTRAPLSLRLRGDAGSALKSLDRSGVTYTADARFPLRVVVDSSEAAAPALLQSPQWVAQDGAAMLVSLLAAPQPGWQVWDVCAAPGGKTFHMADLSAGQAKILATDRSEVRLQKLREQQALLGLSSIDTRVFDPLQANRPLDFGPFDAILVDAPCTGWGTFRRHPDLRWRLQAGDSTRLGRMALSLLERVEAALKPGGALIYSTCTLSPEENEDVIQNFLAKHSGFTLESACDYLPEAFHTAVSPKGWFALYPPEWQLDGAFAARLRKGGKS